MLSTSNIERLIAVKRREIEKEKTQLGLSSQLQEHAPHENNKENVEHPDKFKKQVKFSSLLSEHDDSTEDEKEKDFKEAHEEFDPYIPPDLDRYIRRYIGLPVMLKAGEYSPNNPLVRGERAAGDALLGLGEYERRRNTLRKIRQQQYREYLDQQAKKKQEAKEQAERERREREQREREKDERERELMQERERYSPDRRRSLQQLQSTPNVFSSLREHDVYVQPATTANVGCNTNKVDTGVQVNGFSRPLSVAVQTDETELFRLSPSPSKSQLTQAERELSPRSVHTWAPSSRHYHHSHERRRSYGDFDERSCLLKKCNRDKLTSDLRHTYMPSLFDADAIQLRNIQAEKEAAERRQYYQQELKNQILEQQRIKEERKTREKMLEQAEMRRLEEQLRMLRVAQDTERGRQRHITAAIQEHNADYNNKRSELQREIDAEHQNLLRAASQPTKSIPKRNTTTAKSETYPSKLPFYYPKTYERTNDSDKKPYSMNIPDNSIFSSNYDVDSYLRRNLNFNKDKVSMFDKEDLESPEAIEKIIEKEHISSEKRIMEKIHVPAEKRTMEKVHVPTEKRMVEKGHLPSEKRSTEKVPIEKTTWVEKALVHERPDDRMKPEKSLQQLDDRTRHDRPTDVIEKQPSKKVLESIDSLPIPVLRHSPRTQSNAAENTSMSAAMKKVDDKWKVPVVQKNILKALPNEEGKNVSILTQLGSIRRQLQLEQLKLDRMLSQDDEV